MQINKRIPFQGCATETGCEGEVITVGSDGVASIAITDSENPVAAIHVGMGVCF